VSRILGVRREILVRPSVARGVTYEPPLSSINERTGQGSLSQFDSFDLALPRFETRRSWFKSSHAPSVGEYFEPLEVLMQGANPSPAWE
jgi:hypothetical protein